MKSAHYFFSNPAHRVTDRQTERSLVGRPSALPHLCITVSKDRKNGVRRSALFDCELELDINMLQQLNILSRKQTRYAEN